jgi:hypothetical protein
VEVQASRQAAFAGAPLRVTLGARYADLETDPYRRYDGLWTKGPSAQFTSASLRLAGAARGQFNPFAQISEPVDGEGETWRLIGLEREDSAARFSFSASLGEVSEPYTGDATRGEMRLNWRF